jgi:EAL and modified HD-GYP domain-containing signal transduction protein
MPDEAAATGQVFFTKHPILDDKRKLWGFELALSAPSPGNGTAGAAKDLSASLLASSAFIGVQQAMERGKRIMLGFGEQNLLDKAPYAFSPTQCVVRFQGPVTDQATLLKTLGGLKKDGYLLAVPGQAALAKEIVGLADIVVLDGPGSNGQPQTWPAGVQRLALSVARIEQFEDLRGHGFTLFEGAFFKEAETFAERKLSSHEMSRINILRIIEAEDPDLDALAEAIGSDVSVSFRLLSYLNSAAFSFPQKIKSIKQAIMILGINKMKNWLRAVLLADMAKEGDNPRELVHLSLQRAKFLESVAKEYDYWGFDPGSLFMLGLFSLIDAILGMPMDKVVHYLPLEEKLKAALCREANNEFQPLLDLAESFEDAGWPKLPGMVQKLSFDLETVKTAYSEAMQWAGLFLAPQGGKA